MIVQTKCTNQEYKFSSDYTFIWKSRFIPIGMLYNAVFVRGDRLRWLSGKRYTQAFCGVTVFEGGME